MVAGTLDQTMHTLNICKEVAIAAPVEIAFEAILEELGPAGVMLDGKSLAMKIEPWPGGRWYRDLGHNTGHLWGHVQVIKPPTLLEITGPLFMSYPAISHLQYRLTPEGGGTRLSLVHRAFGHIPAEHREGVHEGWTHSLNIVREIAERRAGAPRGRA